MDGIGDFARGGGIDGGAVDEEAFSGVGVVEVDRRERERWVEDGMENILDM